MRLDRKVSSFMDVVVYEMWVSYLDVFSRLRMKEKLDSDGIFPSVTRAYAYDDLSQIFIVVEDESTDEKCSAEYLTLDHITERAQKRLLFFEFPWTYVREFVEWSVCHLCCHYMYLDESYF